MIILITGGTGLIGKSLSNVLRERGHEVRILSRRENLNEGIYFWDYTQSAINPDALTGIDGIIHLAGATVAKRWTKKYKEEMYSSRIESLNFLASKLIENNQSLRFLICASGANYYGTETTLHTYVETDPSGKDYLAKLCVDWEQAALQFPVETDSKAIVRTSVVIDKNGGALQKMLPSFKLGLGAVLGKGNQVMPCISLEDLTNIYIYIIENQLNGIYNAVGFNLTQKEFARELATKLHRPLFLNVPSFILKLMIGEMSEILLKGSGISNEKIKKSGFQFQQEKFGAIEL